MATEARYRPENIGDWGVPTAVPGGAYGTAELRAEHRVADQVRDAVSTML
ncbi:MAG TPA: hypothetical protein VF510_06350 [Ktedonobacterales bacterium]